MSLIPVKKYYGKRGAFNRNVDSGLGGAYTESPYLDSLKFDSNSTQFISARVNFDAIADLNVFSNTIIVMGNGSDTWGVSCRSTGMVLYTNGGNSGEQAVTINTGIWYHFIGVFDQPNNTIKLYLDGNHIYTDTAYTDNSTDTAGVFRVGSTNSAGFNTKGSFGDIVIGKGTITNAQARALSNGVAPETVVGRENILAYVPCTDGGLDEAYGLFKYSEWVHSSDGYTPHFTLYPEAALPFKSRTQYLSLVDSAAPVGIEVFRRRMIMRKSA